MTYETNTPLQHRDPLHRTLQCLVLNYASPTLHTLTVDGAAQAAEVLDLPDRLHRHVASHVYSSPHLPSLTVHHRLLAVEEREGVKHQRLQRRRVGHAQQLAVAEGQRAALHRPQHRQRLQPDGDGREETGVTHAQRL